MHSIRRGCQSALSNPKSINPITNGSRRAFSRSAACRRGNSYPFITSLCLPPAHLLTCTILGALPQFLEPSSSELSNLLSTLNSKVLLPEHLTKDQRKLVYKQENRARLEAEPIEITLGEITLPLEHINRNRDQPSRWDTIRDVVEASKTPEDWENVVRMMEGFRDAGVRLKPRWFEKIVRKLNEAGMQHLVLKSLQRARETGLRLRDEGVVHQVFKGLHDKAAESEWDAAETKKALSFAEQIVELMEKEDHLGKSEPRPQDLRASPFVIAWPLELAAARAKLHTEGQDRDGKVMKYASRLMNAAHQDDFISVSPYQPSLSPVSMINQTSSPHFPTSLLSSLQLEPHHTKIITNAISRTRISSAGCWKSFLSGTRLDCRITYSARICPWRLRRRNYRITFEKCCHLDRRN